MKPRTQNQSTDILQAEGLRVAASSNKFVDRTAAITGISDMITITVSVPSLIAFLRRRSVTICRSAVSSSSRYEAD